MGKKKHSKRNFVVGACERLASTITFRKLAREIKEGEMKKLRRLDRIKRTLPCQLFLMSDRGGAET